MDDVRKKLCVAHLARAANGIEPLKRFLDSYRDHPGDMDHDLLIIFKGFNTLRDKAAHEALLQSVKHRSIDVSDEGYDITAYMQAVKQLGHEYRYFCFLNSFSIILAPQWLKKLYDNLTQPGVGLVGATGSWLSHCTNAWLWFIHCPSRWYKRQYGQANAAASSTYSPAFMERAVFKAEWVWHRFLYLFYFPPFPNYLVRTNAFMIATETLNSLRLAPVRTKFDAYVFESGRNGLTRQVIASGKTVLVVGKDGKGYPKEAWDKSGTFHQGEQENLLVADNQTEEYRLADSQKKALLTSGSWSQKAFLV